MKKDVMVKIIGSEYDGLDQEQVEQVVKGSYYKKNGKDFILYDVTEGDENVHTMLKIGDEQVEITKNSTAGRVTMMFQQGEFYKTFYPTAAGVLEMKFHTKELVKFSSDDCISMKILYDIYMNEQEIGTRKLQIQVKDI